jgi:L-arabinose isomerase
MKIGLLPFYLELYDRVCKPSQRRPLELFYAQIVAAFRHKGLTVVEAPFCRISREFAAAVRSFERAGVDAMVTLHLAYSPSLESAGILARTKLPLIVLDTTPDYDFSPSQAPEKIMSNHGIHGVQDMCNLLVRNGKPFAIEAGHWQNSTVIERVVKRLHAACIASALRRSRVGRIGKSFAGMGDFFVPPAILKREIGLKILPGNMKYLSRMCKALSKREIDAQVLSDCVTYHVQQGIVAAHQRSVRAGLAVRRWIEREKLTAFTVNFLDFKRTGGLPTVPFLEACRAMQRGIGYAGEGDVLTAALVGALASVYPQTTFTEMFCPDWKGETIFLSHMGEVNLALLSGRPALVEYPFIFGDVDNPVKITGCLRGGEAAFVNLAPLPAGRFRLILAPVAMLQPKGKDNFGDSVRGWMKPRMTIREFLAKYSCLGGTHHAALVYDADLHVLTDFGRFMGWDVSVIGS